MILSRKKKTKTSENYFLYTILCTDYLLPRHELLLCVLIFTYAQSHTIIIYTLCGFKRFCEFNNNNKTLDDCSVLTQVTDRRNQLYLISKQSGLDVSIIVLKFCRSSFLQLTARVSWKKKVLLRYYTNSAIHNHDCGLLTAVCRRVPRRAISLEDEYIKCIEKHSISISLRLSWKIQLKIKRGPKTMQKLYQIMLLQIKRVHRSLSIFHRFSKNKNKNKNIDVL